MREFECMWCVSVLMWEFAYTQVVLRATWLCSCWTMCSALKLAECARKEVLVILCEILSWVLSAALIGLDWDNEIICQRDVIIFYMRITYLFFLKRLLEFQFRKELWKHKFLISKSSFSSHSFNIFNSLITTVSYYPTRNTAENSGCN